jgi:Rrf2 family iron-sulfur cluster assembly transcriptional regulator
MLAMMELARRGGAVPARALDIAKAYGLSKGYLEGLLATLKRAGLVRAVRGPGGGWVLVKGATKTKPLEIYAALEGPTTLVPCAEDAKLCPTGQSKCRARSLWVAMGKALERVLKVDTLAQLAGVAPKKRKAKAKKKAKAKPKKAKAKLKRKPKTVKRSVKKARAKPKPKSKARAKRRPARKPVRAKTKATRRGKILKAPRRARLRKSA